MMGVKKKSQAPTQFARQLRKNLTDAERLLWQHLRDRQLNGHKFRRQQPIGTYIVDFVCFEKKIVIEVDGGQHADKHLDDSKRMEWLATQGFRELRFWNHEVLTNLAGALEAIRLALGTPTTTLPHVGEGQDERASLLLGVRVGVVDP